MVIIAINLFYLIYILIKKENITTPLAGSVIYVLMMALPWANVEYSEVYSLFFLSFSLVNIFLQFVLSEKNSFNLSSPIPAKYLFGSSNKIIV